MKEKEPKAEHVSKNELCAIAGSAVRRLAKDPKMGIIEGYKRSVRAGNQEPERKDKKKEETKFQFLFADVQ